MTPDWAPLDRELTRWQAAGLTLPLWWRDDDAVAPSPALDRLSTLSAQSGLPVHLAVIPAGATDDLARWRPPHVIPVVHGWAHANHAPQGEKKAEFGLHRPIRERLDDARQALTHLQDLFGPALRPLFVPPWNRIGSDMLPGLAEIGFDTLSTFTPRKAPRAAPGLAQINTHLDPIDWKGSRSLAPPDRLIAQIAAQLTDRREGRADNDEPYGILTHHLVHDDQIWQFTEEVISRLMCGPVLPWTAQAKDED